MLLADSFNTVIEKNGLFRRTDQLLLAVSGGIDSVVLCELCDQAGYSFSVLHCNFQLRGAESERDEQFVRQLASGYHAEILVRRFDTEIYATDHKLSIQEAARDLRYTWFKEVITERQLNLSNQPNVSVLLLTAHHADDNNETLLMNFFRGTGLQGLSGIPAVNGDIRRPLLPFFKSELVEFAQTTGLSWVEDSSNMSTKYTRNLLRHTIIPAIRDAYPQIEHSLKDNIERFKSIGQLYYSMLDKTKKKLITKKGSEFHIPVKLLLSYNNAALIYELVSAFGFSEKQVPEIIKLAESDSGKFIVSPGGNYRLIKHRNWFIITPVMSLESNTIVINDDTEPIEFPLGTLHIGRSTDCLPGTSAADVRLDARDIRFPLMLRRAKAGDYFYPLGMKKKKKLNRFLIDQKASKTEKENCWVIESERRIIWVVGQRIDERFKIKPATKQTFRLILIPK